MGLREAINTVEVQCLMLIIVLRLYWYGKIFSIQDRDIELSKNKKIVYWQPDFKALLQSDGMYDYTEYSARMRKNEIELILLHYNG